MELTYPRKLRPGDEVRVIAPSRSRAMVNEHNHTAITNVDIGHTNPIATIPLGGEAAISAGPGDLSVVLTRH